GNAGAMNSFEITNSKVVGLVVLIIDALKGLLSVYLCLLVFPLNFVYAALALFFAVFSHCFNPWLNFKGGRGLATAAGGAALLSPLILISWGALWVLLFLLKKDILIANVGATILTIFLALSSIDLIFNYTYPTPDSYGTLVLFSSGLLTIIFIKHIEPLKEIIYNFKNPGKRKKDE
ncbi:MAG TPA: glycerol-3-phosphate acyltransferase, partial [Ignavibacteriaceae bacterium]|nr:glycerol-3-phosphate acyltransferase [Ignavibacteriaceae bacterium]